MSLTVTCLLTLGLACECPGTLHLLHLGPAPALLSGHLETGGAITPVAPLRAVVATTGHHLTARVPTRGGGLSAGKPGGRLTTGAESVQGEWAGGTGARMADEVTGVITTGE